MASSSSTQQTQAKQHQPVIMSETVRFGSDGRERAAVEERRLLRRHAHLALASSGDATDQILGHGREAGVAVFLGWPTNLEPAVRGPRAHADATWLGLVGRARISGLEYQQ